MWCGYRPNIDQVAAELGSSGQQCFSSKVQVFKCCEGEMLVEEFKAIYKCIMCNLCTVTTLYVVVVCVTDIIKESLCAYCADDMPLFKTIVAFDCRGVQPTDFEPRVCLFYMEIFK